MARGARTRLELRLEEELKKAIEEAAELTGESVSDFVRRAAAERANDVVLDQRWTVVPVEYFDELLTQLDEPPEVIPELRAAAERASGLIEWR